MLFFLIIIKIIYIESYKDFLIDKLFNKYEIKSLEFSYCQNYSEDTFYYRGRLTNIKEIIDSNNINDIKDYKYVFIHEIKYYDNVTLFPKSTVFFTFNGLSKYYNKNYCFIPIYYDIEKYKPFYYIVIGDYLLSSTRELAEEVYAIFSFVELFFFMILLIRLCRYETISFLYAYMINYINSIFSMGAYLLCLLINISLLSHLLYTFYKSLLFSNLLFLINGFTILKHGNYYRILKKKILYLFLYNSILTFILLYIIYFFPSINNTILFIFKNIIEHLLLLLPIIKATKKKFMPLYHQYNLEKILNRPLAISCKFKLIVYIKILIFSLIYCILFIIISFIELLSSFINYTELFYYNYYVNIFLEIFLGFVYGIIFFPSKVPTYFFLEIIYDYDNIIVVGFDKDNNKSNIGNLTKKTLKNKYAKKRRPIVCITPFSNDKNLFKNLYLGTIEINNQNIV